MFVVSCSPGTISNTVRYYRIVSMIQTNAMYIRDGWQASEQSAQGLVLAYCRDTGLEVHAHLAAAPNLSYRGRGYRQCRGTFSFRCFQMASFWVPFGRSTYFDICLLSTFPARFFADYGMGTDDSMFFGFVFWNFWNRFWNRFFGTVFLEPFF